MELNWGTCRVQAGSELSENGLNSSANLWLLLRYYNWSSDGLREPAREPASSPSSETGLQARTQRGQKEKRLPSSLAACVFGPPLCSFCLSFTKRLQPHNILQILLPDAHADGRRFILQQDSTWSFESQCCVINSTSLRSRLVETISSSGLVPLSVHSFSCLQFGKQQSAGCQSSQLPRASHSRSTHVGTTSTLSSRLSCWSREFLCVLSWLFWTCWLRKLLRLIRTCWIERVLVRVLAAIPDLLIERVLAAVPDFLIERVLAYALTTQVSGF